MYVGLSQILVELCASELYFIDQKLRCSTVIYSISMSPMLSKAAKVSGGLGDFSLDRHGHYWKNSSPVILT